MVSQSEILNYLKTNGPQTVDSLIKIFNYQETFVKESVLRLRERCLIKPNDKWEMELVVKD